MAVSQLQTQKQNRRPVFSVIMPAYNGMHYIDAAVTSVLSQSYADLEYIITDDGSTDGTRDYLEKLSKNDTRIKVIFLEKNGGIGNARNTAIHEADGEYLLFIDQDDFFVDGAFDMLAAKLVDEGACGTDLSASAEAAAKGADVMCFGMNRVREDGSLIQAFPPELSGSALRWDLCTVWTYAVRRSIVVDNGIEFPVDSMNEDMIFSLRLARYTDRIERMDECLYCHRINEFSTSNNMSVKFDRYPDSRRLVFEECRNAYDAVDSASDKKLIFLTALAYYYSIQFGIFRKDAPDTKLKEYRLHRQALEEYFGDYLHGHSVTLFRPKCRRFIYRLVVWVSYRMEKYLGQAFFEKFILLMGR